MSLSGYNTYFPNILLTEHLPDGVNLRLHRAFSFIDPIYGMITMPRGYDTDLASTPRFIWWLIPPHGRYKFAAVIHDHLYRTCYFGTSFAGWRKADRVLWRAMKYSPARSSAAIRIFIYMGLLVGGWYAYAKAARSLRASRHLPH